MIIGNTVHFIHLAYPTDIVTDIRNYNHFNPKELNPILKLAICEDNPSHYEIIHTILQKYPPGAFEITHFTSGDEFLRAAAENGCPYSIVLTDIDLGSDAVNGISLAEKINHISPDTQIIFISQYLQYATAVYETEHAYFIHKQQMEFLPEDQLLVLLFYTLFHYKTLPYRSQQEFQLELQPKSLLLLHKYFL